MQLTNEDFLYSPSDLITYMESPFASYMERWHLENPSISNLIDVDDPMLKSLQKKGYTHEERFLNQLLSEYKSVALIEGTQPNDLASKTIAAMKSGVEVIAQGYLLLGEFAGYADFLIRVPGASKLGSFHYEVWDTKLSRKMKPYFVIQLCCYAEMLREIQGVLPQNLAVILGNNEKHNLRTLDYFAYYSGIKSSFLKSQKSFTPDSPPDPAASQSHGRWSKYAQNLLTKRDHLSQVANITRTQIQRLEQAGITTMHELAETTAEAIPKLNSDILARLKAQADIQITSEGKECPQYRILTHDKGTALGLALLPPHSDADVFFDIEGDPLVEGGLEYLWGATHFDECGERTFRDFWAHDQKQEKRAFEEFISWIFDRWKENPTMHVYHYAAYEITAIRKLMGRYGTMEHEVDTLLRNNVFVDLYKIVRHGLMIGEPSYSIKNVEHIYRGKRDTDVASGGDSVVVYEAWKDDPDGETWKTSAILKSIRDYNIDDCNSTQELTAWLRDQQQEHNIGYLNTKADKKEKIEEEVNETTLLRDKILAEAENHESAPEQYYLLRNLAWLLEFHRRENKPMWWRLFDRLGLTELDLHDDMDCLTGLVRTGKAPFKPTERARNLVYEYTFDTNQPFRGQTKSFYVLGEENHRVSTINFDADQGIIQIQSKNEPNSRIGLVPDEFVNPNPIPSAIQDVVEALFKQKFPDCAITDFLTRQQPRFKTSARNPIISTNLDNDGFLNNVVMAAKDLDDSYLCIQGPPGAGKTYTAKHIIGDLLAQGKRVGISSNSHKAILNLMLGVASYVRENSIQASLVKIGGDEEDQLLEENNITYSKKPREWAELAKDPSVCIGGTAWAFCNPCFSKDEQGHQQVDKLDYLFVDEAGQVSVANLVGMSRSCRNIILMGDQMQLGQPIQASHPEDSGQSILEYLLQDHATTPPDMGVFLPKTFRMHGDVCQLISEQVYESRLHADTKTQRHMIQTRGPLITRRTGICFIPVQHEGNTQGSDEEVVAIKAIANELIGSAYWPEKSGDPARQITWEDILFVAPYNYQVNLLKAALGPDARIGSVDKFQGQEAPIVILSMCASDASETPRGIDFLFSKNRLNVALSRAQALAIVVGSPTLAQTPVTTVEQMELINFYSTVVQNI